MVKVVHRVESCAPQLIKVIAAETGRLLQSGAPILNLSQGSPNFPMFDAAVDAATRRIKSKKLPYTTVNGMLETRQVCADFMNSVILGQQREETPMYTANHICVTNGAVQAIFNSLALSVENANDVVVSPLPTYGLYEADTHLLGGTFAPLDCGSATDGFAIQPDDVESAFLKYGERLRVLILSAPSNPTGCTLSDEEAKALADTLERQRQQFPDSFSIILDEVYTGIVSSSHVSILRHATPALRRICFFIASVSKGLGGAPGARAGFLACADQSLITHVTKLQMATTSNASVVGQEILAASLKHILSRPDHILGEVSMHYRARTDLVCDRLHQIRPSLLTCRPRGAFYVVADFSCLGLPTDTAVRECLRDAYLPRGAPNGGDRKPIAASGIAVVPLSAFGVPPSLCLVRLCCALDVTMLNEAMNVIHNVVQSSEVS